MIAQSPSLDITMSIGEKDDKDNETVSSTNECNQTSIRSNFSELNLEQTDTMDYSNCATSPSKATYLSSIPGTIYYNGLDSVSQPHIENARKVSDAEFFGESEPIPRKIHSAPHQCNSINSLSSSVPRMQWSPPQPLSGIGNSGNSSSGNDHEEPSSPPRYTAKAYTSSPVQDDIVPAIPVEEESMDGFTDTVLKRGKNYCGRLKGQKTLLILSGLVIALAIAAVTFSFVYVAATSEGQSTIINCHPECYDNSRPTVICRCDCYTKKDDKYYTCGTQSFDDDADVIGDTSSVDDNLGKSDLDVHVELSYYNSEGSVDSSDIEPDDSNDPDMWTPYTTDDDTDDGDDPNDDSINNFECSTLCYSKNIHRDWNPTECNPHCYQHISQYTRRYDLWIQWYMHDGDTAHPPS